MTDVPVLPKHESENDPVLAGLGFRGDPLIYRPRLERMRVLAEHGRGPLAWFNTFMAAVAHDHARRARGQR